MVGLRGAQGQQGKELPVDVHVSMLHPSQKENEHGANLRCNRQRHQQLQNFHQYPHIKDNHSLIK